MNKKLFLDQILPGNYFITKSMELTKSKSAGTLWYTKKFIVLYYYIFLAKNITTLAIVREIRAIFDDYIQSLPQSIQGAAQSFFYASHETADLRSPKFRLFNDFAGDIRFSNDNELLGYYEGAKKYYFAFLMESGGQAGVKAYIKEQIYKSNFVYSNLETLIKEYSDTNGYNQKKYRSLATYIQGMKNDYMAFVRNERQILFYFGFFHSKSSGSIDREFSSLTPIGELALRSNYYELIAIWEHQKVKMLSQPVNIEIRGLAGLVVHHASEFMVNRNPYLTILRCLEETNGFSKEAYQYIISRLPEFPMDGLDVSIDFIEKAKEKVHSFHRKGDETSEDFNKELLKYILGIRSDLSADGGHNPLGLCQWSANGLQITNKKRLKRLNTIYSALCSYKNRKYERLFDSCNEELKKQYLSKLNNNSYTEDPQIKIRWDMYNIHTDLPILLAIIVLIIESKINKEMEQKKIKTFANEAKYIFPNILKILGLNSTTSLEKEIKKIYIALIDWDFEVYMQEDSIELHPSVSAYLDNSLEDLNQKIKTISNSSPIYHNGVRKRNTNLIALLKSYNLQRYTSSRKELLCECCGNPSFLTYKGEYYAEYHHLIPFSKFDGPDHYLNIVALCPMCHRKMHYLKYENKKKLYDNISHNSYSKQSIKDRLIKLFAENKLKSYQLEFLLSDNAIDKAAYNSILQSTGR